ncbi:MULTISPECIES: hypothetical protein [unclassified Leptolyngbya]|uniref:hypothetical protein n=1 Tax=unclassified Leptolyngbya TaxID=2650499 RepID=UPI001684EE32|nr:MULTISPECIES: hypothetical protein [unclassified Leptolyngbya]MBD1912104.1 hypothetical protein [Leptolyngbya sp. FACHB-8]MBD2154995.1 hypothetical protein [Leptolyngbya sp. FACHB-16]
MNDPSLSDSSNNPDQAVISSEQAQPMAPTNVSGSAMLDARTATDGSQPEGEPISDPIATNVSRASSGDAKTAGVSTTGGSFSTGEEHSPGQVNLQNNPDLPDPDMQGALPDTDPMVMPTDPDANLPT